MDHFPIEPPTDDDMRIARAVLEPLTDRQRQAVYLVVVDAAKHVAKEEDQWMADGRARRSWSG